MKEISIFDVIGPNMIGPSSSHTGGAVRIALLVKKIVSKEVKKVEFVLYGSFAKTYKGHGTDRALVAGILGMDTEDERIKDSFKYAQEAGLEYKFIESHEEAEEHPNTVDVIVTDIDDEVTSLRGCSIGGGNIKIVAINGIGVEFTGEYYTIIVKQKDQPGVVAYITTCLSHYNINIAFMKLYREEKGTTAYTIIEADEKIDEHVIDEIESDPNIIDVKMISGI